MGMGMNKARHLMARAGFGVGPEALRRLSRRSVSQGVDALLSGVRVEAVTEAPSWGMLGISRAAGDRRERRRLNRERGQALRAWWFAELLATPSPLTERMTLFWHSHLTSGLRKVNWAPFLYRQNVTWRRHAVGSYEALLKAMLRDPAMLFYLDNQSNHRREPNENFARELLELFTLGEGHYTERDVKEAARALTGWRIRPRTGEFRFVRADHDKGQKVFLGKRGAWDGDDIIDIILARPQAARWGVERLWRALISPTPDADEVARLARVWRAAGYQMKPLLRATLKSSAFWEASHQGALVKSPVDLLVGTVKALELDIREPEQLAKLSRRLGQDLFEPPNVKGWPGGTRWISSHTLLLRHQMLGTVSNRALKQRRRAPEGWRSLAKGVGDVGEAVASLMLPVAPVSASLRGDDLQSLLGRVLRDPAYQLK